MAGWSELPQELLRLIAHCLVTLLIKSESHVFVLHGDILDGNDAEKEGEEDSSGMALRRGVLKLMNIQSSAMLSPLLAVVTRQSESSLPHSLSLSLSLLPQF
ncbi:hypothetical protein KY285_020570 [Solanum tuberosum]|nr:hypothetical protein KY285_020570 [Solanum tuberosum]